MAAPQFGERQAGREYRDRPAAFGILDQAGKIALVRVEKPGQHAWHDLPGGAIDAGETPEQAVVREYGEETGLKVSVGQAFTAADQYFVNTDGEAFDNLATFFTLEFHGHEPRLQVEDDHTLVWVEPREALAILRHEAHAWAVTAWLRLRARA